MNNGADKKRHGCFRQWNEPLLRHSLTSQCEWNSASGYPIALRYGLCFDSCASDTGGTEYRDDRHYRNLLMVCFIK